jgi:glycosyltransferase involved in cell wall biosynthesis
LGEEFNSNIKILHVIRDISPETGGPVSAIRGLSHAQIERGDEIRIVTTDYGLADGYTSAEHEFIYPCSFEAWRYAPSLGKAMKKHIKWADAVHIHTLWEYPSLIAARMARTLNKPFLLRPCGMLDAWSMGQGSLKKKIYLKLFSKDLYSDFCRLHFTTEAEKEKSIYPAHLDSVIIENGISDVAFSDANNARDFFSHFPELTGKRIVLFLGRIHPKKQPDIALGAFAQAAVEFPKAHMVFAGPYEDSYRDKLVKMARKLGVHKKITFTGMIQGASLYGSFRAAEMFVLPSMQENFGLAVAEAMANACPVIVSEHVDIKGYIQKGEAGLVCDATADAFAVAIHRVMSMPQLGESMGQQGREVAKRYFRWNIAADRLDTVYQEMTLKQKRGTT